MNRQLFLQLLEHPDSVSEQESVALKKFTEDFPYCQTGHLLFVKHLHSLQSVHYPEQLKVAAAYAADRKVLYNLIHAAPASPLNPLQRRRGAVLTESVEEEIPATPSPVDKREDHFEEPLEQISSETIPEKKIVEEPMTHTDIIQKRLEEIASKKVAPEVQPEELKSEPAQATKEISISAPEIVKLKIPEEKKPKDLKSGKHSFTDWLKTVKKEPAPAAVSRENSAPAAHSTDEIINRFIETEPRIIPSKTEFYNPIKMAKQSLEEHDDLISETLAGIFAQQGNLPKAIEMYRKLMLANPEKSSSFATLIEKLAQQLNEGK